MPGKIFINYRRDDDPGFTQALYQRLEEEFPSGNLFMDVEGHIKPGDDFVEVLSAQVAQCDVMLAVIGPRWVVLMDARVGSADDFVTIEIRAALEQDKRVIPVLVGGAGMPASEAVPEPIRALARRNAVGLRPERFKADCQGLMSALKEQLAAAEQERAARTEAERAAAEAERLKREAEEAARIAAEERARAQAIAGLSQEEIRKAEELANWDFIKERSDAQLLRDHLARFPGGVTVLYARTRLEELVWRASGLEASSDMAALEAFLEEFPNGTHAEAVGSRLTDLRRQAEEIRAAEERHAQQTAEWGVVATSTDPAVVEAFLEKWPRAEYTAGARARLHEVEWYRLTASTNPAAIQAFLGKWPKGQHAPAARAQLQRALEAAEWGAIAAGSGAGAIEAFLEKWPTGKHAAPARALLHEVEWRALAASSDAEAIEAFLGKWPAGERRHLARALLEDVEWQTLAASEDPRAVGAFLGKWPEGRHTAEARSRLMRLKAVRFTRRAFIVTAGGAAFVTFVPGQPVWRRLYDRWSLSKTSAHSSAVAYVVLAQDGRRVVSSGAEGLIRVWELADDHLQFRSEQRAAFRGNNPVAITRDGRIVFGDGPQIKVWELQSGNVDVLATTRVPAPSGVNPDLWLLNNFDLWWTSIAVTPDGQRIIGGRSDGIVKAWQIGGRELSTPPGRHSGSVTSIAVTPNGRRLISGGSDGTMKVWELPNCCVLHDFPAGHQGRVTSLAIMREGRQVISGSWDSTVRLWEIANRSQVNLWHSGRVNSVAVTPSGRLAIVGSGDAAMRVWLMPPALPAAGDPVYPLSLTGHLNWGFDWNDMSPRFMGVNSVAVTPDGRRAISGGDDGTIRVWPIG